MKSMKEALVKKLARAGGTGLRRKTVYVALALALVFSLAAAIVPASPVMADTQSISGDPIEVKVFDAGRIEPYYDNWGSRYQYYNYKACNNVLWLNGGSMGFDAPDTSTADCSSCTDFTAVSNSKPDAWTIETVYDAGSTGVRITQRIEYVNGAKYYNMHWSVENTGSSTYTDLRFMHGGDTYFGGIDSSNGHYNSTVDMVYLTNAGVTGIMGLLGTPTSPIDHYYEDHYSSVRSAMNSGNHLPNTVNPSYVDAGYAVEWDRTTLAPGQTWDIAAIEKWTSTGDVQVMAPAGQSGHVGDTFDYSFTVQNLQSSSDTFDLSTSSSQGWTVSLPGGSTVTIGAGSSETAHVQVTATSTGTDLTTLTATSQTDPLVTNDDSVTTVTTSCPDVETATGTGSAELCPSSGTLENLTAVAEGSLPAGAASSMPSFSFPHGFFSFNVTGLSNGDSVTVTLTMPSAVPVGTQYWKWGPTPGDPSDHWYQLPMGSDDGNNVITITLTDNGLGDDVLTGEDGEIVDQGGPGNPGGDGAAGVSVFPSLYVGIAAALAAGVLAYLLRTRIIGRKAVGT